MSEKSYLPEKLVEKLEKQKYHLVGRHSAVKACKWLRESMNSGGRACYKNKFYGIKSWRCVQCTPMLGCDLACRFCWRITPKDVNVKWDEMSVPEWDEPEQIIEGILKEQTRIVSGYKGSKTTDLERWKEANKPAHVALSLSGEPMLYPRLGELIEGIHKRNMTTFLVSNGTFPEAITELKTLPTQFYLSIVAPNEEIYFKTCRPKLPDAWDRLNESLEIFSSLGTRRTLRMTLAKGLNMTDESGFAELIMKAKPDYVEPKAFMFVGGARSPNRKLKLVDMPTHEEIKAFAEKLAEETGYLLSDEYPPSRVVLLCRNKSAERKRMIEIKK